MIKIMIVIVILACIGPFFINGPNGEPLMTLEDLKPDFSLSDFSLPDMGSIGGEDEEQQATTTLYRWQDEEGVWHFSNKEEDAQGSETIEVDNNINTMPAFKAPPEARKQGATGQPAPLAGTPIGQGLETINEAMELQSTIDSRKADMDKVLQKAGG